MAMSQRGVILFHPSIILLLLFLVVVAWAQVQQHFELQPTAALVEQRRRRKLGTNSNLESESELEYPPEWFHPYARAVYATHHGHSHEDDPAFQDFQTYRHLSRYERHLRSHHRLDLHPRWHGNYSDTESDTVWQYTNSTNSTFSLRRKLQNSLIGGKFDHYQGIPLSQGYGTHYVHLWVGSPIPQRQSVIVDTGSHFTAFPCLGCDQCGQEHHTDPYFDPRKSSTFHSLHCPLECHEEATCQDHTNANVNANTHSDDKYCQFTQSYTEGSSWRAYQAKDIVYCGGTDVLEAANPLDRQYSVPFMFGCLQEETGLFVTQLADGIMGMSAHETTLTKQLYNQGKLEYNMFGLCFRKELGTSKRGVTAGSMTLGGVSSTLDTSPMVYAKNTQSYGWFTVHVQNIYVAKNGGTQFLLDHQDALKDIVHIPIDVQEVNSGKGVIVDSGTTDTYLNANALPAFVKVWKQVTGMEYTHGPVYLTQSQLKRLPTILIQCQAASTSATVTTAPVLGQVGLLDPKNSSDLLLAIPATNYMEYSATLKLYTSRLYFTESRGGVLGANAMQGHNVLFDWQHGRIGFSQSSCAYDLISIAKQDEHVNFASETFGNDCVLGPPILTQTCMDSIDVSICEASDRPSNVDVIGTEIWTRLVESPGSAGSCQEAAMDWSLQQHLQLDGSEVTCTLAGLCEEHQPCHVPCLKAMEHYRNETKQSNNLSSNNSDNNDQADGGASDGHSKEEEKATSCGDSFWSACDYNCQQSRVISATISGDENDICLEVSRSTRDCHVDACGRSDPCAVPFLVHAILVLEGAAEEWTLTSLETFQEEFTKVSHLAEFSSIAARRNLFQQGDVDVLIVRPWYNDDDEWEDEEEAGNEQEERQASGIQLILQISIFNPKAHKISPEAERSLLQEVGVLWTDFTFPFRLPKQEFTCNPSDLYPLAKDAVELANGILEHEGFGERLAESMPSYHTARVISSWTIGTQVYDGNVNYLGPIAMTPYLFLLRILYEASLVFVFISILSCIGQMFTAYRHLCSPIFRRWCCGKPARYQTIPTNEDDSENGSTNSLANAHTQEIELELSFAHSFSDNYKKNAATTTKRRNSMTIGREEG
jgi:hypothetical protein